MTGEKMVDKEVEKSLDALFGTKEDIQNGFEELKRTCEEPAEPISNYNTKQVLQQDEVSTNNAKELVNEKVIEKLETKIAEKSEELISSANSDRALFDELASTEGVPISKASTEGIHDADATDNMDLISTHNSDHALPDELANNEDVPISTINAEQMHENEIVYCEPISTVNSKQFVGDLKQTT